MHPTRKERLPWREVDGRAVIVQPAQGEVHELNPVGTFLWKSADGTIGVNEIAARLAERFEVAPEQAAADAREFYAGLEARGLITFA
jgi:hypothetical protein